MTTSSRNFIRCRFQAETTTRIGKLLASLMSSEDGRELRDLIQEAIEVYWMPSHLLSLYQSNQITEEQYRQQVLLSVARQQAWFSYCQRLTAVGPVMLEAQMAAIQSTSESWVGQRSQVDRSNQELVLQKQVDGAIATEVSEVSSPAVEAPQRFARRRPQSMKPAFGGAFRQDDDD